MDPAGSIQKLGFRKWYERELIKGHAALVTCFLCAITVAALAEWLGAAPAGWGPLGVIAVMAVVGFLGWTSWRTYITILQRAERYGQRSNCPQCNAYGRFKVIESGVDTLPDAAALAVAPLESAWIKVECRKCGARWRLPD